MFPLTQVKICLMQMTCNMNISEISFIRGFNSVTPLGHKVRFKNCLRSHVHFKVNHISSNLIWFSIWSFWHSSYMSHQLGFRWQSPFSQFAKKNNNCGDKNLLRKSLAKDITDLFSSILFIYFFSIFLDFTWSDNTRNSPWPC